MDHTYTFSCSDTWYHAKHRGVSREKSQLEQQKITIPTSLDVTKNVALTFLACDGNQLTSLDVTKNAALEELFCDENVTVTGYSG